jgi:hypothetical protein
VGRLPTNVSRGRDGADVPVSCVKGAYESRALHELFVRKFFLKSCCVEVWSEPFGTYTNTVLEEKSAYEYLDRIGQPGYGRAPEGTAVLQSVTCVRFEKSVSGKLPICI